MCLAVPGKILSIEHHAAVGAPRTAVVDFQGSQVEANLIFTPEAGEGDWVLVHAGFAIQCLDEEEALTTWSYLEAEDLEEVSDAAGEAKDGG
jgi:hydrogenase expression/formation protein HypC